MRQALDLAQAAQSQGEVPVGALVVENTGQILGRGWNNVITMNDPCAHAEILALRAAGQKIGNHRLTNAVLVVTLEPCIMCLGAIIQARLAGVIFAAPDPKAGCLGSQMQGHELPWSNHHFWVLAGVLGEESSLFLRAFFQQRRQEKQFQKNLTER